MKRIILMMLTGCFLTVLGCSNAHVKADKVVGANAPPVTGKYFNKMTPSIYIELKGDGTFDHTFGKRNKSGKYVVKGNRVILTYENDKSFDYKLEGNTLVDNDEFIFTK